LCISAENRKRTIGNALARAAKTLLSLGAPDCPVVHRTVSGAPGWLRRTFCSREKLAKYGYNSPDCPVCTGLSGVHRTVSGEPTVGCAIRARHVAEPTVGRGHRTVWCAPDSVRCANGSQAPTVDYAPEGKKSAPDTVRCAPDCPVRQATEGKICLPGLLSTAPSCLGAIKGTPRRMEEQYQAFLEHS
jgi:hypothetical protein